MNRAMLLLHLGALAMADTKMPCDATDSTCRATPEHARTLLQQAATGMKQIAKHVNVAAPSTASLSTLIPMPTELHNCATEYCEITMMARTISLGPSLETYTRGFDGGLAGFPVGPTIRIKPGDTLKVELKNQLGSYNPKEHGSYIGYLNSTNFHTHGLHVSGAKKGDKVQDYIFTSIEPGGSQKYDIELPPNHMPGLHFYHTHHHHSTAVQVAGGAAGLIVVEDPPDYLPKTIAEMREQLLLLTLINTKLLRELAELGQDELMKLPGTNSKTVYVNGQVLPTLTVQPGEWVRLRMVFSSIESTLRMHTHKKKQDQTSADCELRLLAKDGIYLPTLPRDIHSINLFPGARADVALRCFCPNEASECSVFFTSDDPRRPPFEYRENINNVDEQIFKVDVKGPVIDSVVPEPVSLRRPCYLVDLEDVALAKAGLTIAEENKNHIKMSHKKVYWNHGNGRYVHDMPAEDKIEEESLGRLTFGQLQEITIEGFKRHPFHLHVNPYQIQEWAEELHDVYFQPGDWHDVIMDPADGGNVRFQTDRFSKESVVHCHFLEHEDEGMMHWLWIEDGEQEDALWPGAQLIDPTCYNDYFLP